MPAPPTLECFFDCSSPWTWLGFHHLRPLARELGVKVSWRPVLVGGIFNAVNPTVYAFRESGPAAKQAYLKKDLQDWAHAAGLSIHFPPRVFPVNSVKAMRAAIWADQQPTAAADATSALEPFCAAVFESYWSQQNDISQDAVLADCALEAGLDAQALLAATADPVYKAALKANTDEAIARGAFGSPTFFVGGDDMYFGNDRLPLLRAAVLRRQAAAG